MFPAWAIALIVIVCVCVPVAGIVAGVVAVSLTTYMLCLTHTIVGYVAICKCRIFTLSYFYITLVVYISKTQTTL